jgi:hypothetical protein
MELFIRGEWFKINGVRELLTLLDGMDTERNQRLGQLAYETYCCRLSEHQPCETLSWDRLPTYMRDTWTMVAEVIEVYVKDRNGHK